MVTIIGSGMGEYNFSNINLNLKEFDKIICDKNFSEEGENILKLSFREVKEYILSNFDKNLLYVVTGSPLFYSGATVIANKLPKEMVKIIDNTSAFNYLLCKLSIPFAQCGVLSTHGIKTIDLSTLLVKKYSFVFCDDNSVKILREALFFVKDKIKVTLGLRLNYIDEEIKEINIFDENLAVKSPYVLLIKRLFEENNGNLQDENFVKENGMITKKYKRDLSLINLDLKPNLSFWDIGAGSGSVAIEAYQRYKVKTTLFEKNPKRAAMIEQNLKTHNLIDTKLIIGNAEDKFISLDENPDRIFIGGGGEEVIKKIPYLFEILNQNGVILINAITLKHLNLILNILNEANIEYEIFSLALTTYKGRLDLVEPQRQLFQIKIIKP